MVVRLARRLSEHARANDVRLRHSDSTRAHARARREAREESEQREETAHLGYVGAVWKRYRRRVSAVAPPLEHVLLVRDAVCLVASFQRRFLVDADDTVGTSMERGKRGVRLRVTGSDNSWVVQVGSGWR